METALKDDPLSHVAGRCGRQTVWSSINLDSSFPYFETNFKEQARDARGNKEVPMLPLYSNSAAKLQFTVVYRGYDLDVTRALSGWRVGVHPKTADLPIIGRSEIYAHYQDKAVVEAKGRIDGALSFVARSI
jgi:hypothetical protein